MIEALTDNDNFPTTVPTLESVTALNTAYTQCLNNAANGGRVEIALKNEQKKIVLAALRQLAMNIEMQAYGDVAKLVTSGFELTSAADGPSNLGVPTDFKLSDGMNPGEIKLSVKGVPNAVTYLHEITQGEITENSVWMSEPSTSKEFIFKGLRSSTKVYGRTKAVGRKGQQSVSVILSRIVQ